MNQFKGVKVLAVAPFSAYNSINTSIDRIAAMKALGFDVQIVDSHTKYNDKWSYFKYRVINRLFRLGFPIKVPNLNNTSQKILHELHKSKWNILWLDKCLDLDMSSFLEIRKHTNVKLIIGFSPDDMNARHNQSQQFLDTIHFYDFYLTTKSYNVSELSKLGCKQVFFIENGADPDIFRPIKCSEDSIKKYGGDVGFIGSYESERFQSMLHLARKGIKVRIWGLGWDKVKYAHKNLIIECRPLFGDDFSAAISSFKINLGFLRKINRDLQTTRSIEIPFCGGFLLAERTEEHSNLFKEGEEAEFFSTNEELFQKCNFYLENDFRRIAISESGRKRCITSGYSNQNRLNESLIKIIN